MWVLDMMIGERSRAGGVLYTRVVGRGARSLARPPSNSMCETQMSLVWRATVPLSDCWVQHYSGRGDRGALRGMSRCCAGAVRCCAVRWLRVPCGVLRATRDADPPAALLVLRLQTSRARSSVKDDKDGHLVYWRGYVMGARCSCPQHT